jgi:hypothetical protein
LMAWRTNELGRCWKRVEDVPRVGVAQTDGCK